jgi:hypothetical protein
MSRPENPEKKDRAPRTSDGSTESGGDRARPGMPDEESVLSEKAFTSPGGNRYRIIRTDEMDPYDAPPPPEERRSERADPRDE